MKPDLRIERKRLRWIERSAETFKALRVVRYRLRHWPLRGRIYFEFVQAEQKLANRLHALMSNLIHDGPAP